MASLALAFIFVPPQIVEISEAQLAQGLEDNLPYQVDRGVLVTVQAATAQLSDANKIIVTAQFDAAGLTLEGTGIATIDSTIRYENGKFYLSDLRHDDISFEFSENSDETISAVRTTLEGILRRESEEATSSDDDDRIDQLAKANEYYETQLREDAADLLDKALGSFPVYNLNRANGSMRLAALALDDVQISAEKILISLSLQKIIVTLAGFLGTFMLFVVMFLGPENTGRFLAFLYRIAKGKKSEPNDGSDL
jgi:hypothetical protein